MSGIVSTEQMAPRDIVALPYRATMADWQPYRYTYAAYCMTIFAISVAVQNSPYYPGC